MDNPDDEKTTINVKGVSTKAWDRAKNAAAKQDETMGVWLSRAANQLADMEAGPREFPPALSANLRPEMVKPPGLTAPELAGLMQSMAALATATGTPPAKADIRRAYALVDDHVREARGMPPRPIRMPTRPGKANGQSLALEGKSEAISPVSQG
jgi:hypothetical protein